MNEMKKIHQYGTGEAAAYNYNYFMCSREKKREIENEQNQWEIWFPHIKAFVAAKSGWMTEEKRKTMATTLITSKSVCS